MWFDDISKGRGMPEKFANYVPSTLSLLLQEKILIVKTSKSARKYALNPERRAEIHQILRARAFNGVNICRLIARDAQLASARDLDPLDEYNEPPRRA
jgi:hypothetical protein